MFDSFFPSVSQYSRCSVNWKWTHIGTSPASIEPWSWGGGKDGEFVRLTRRWRDKMMLWFQSLLGWRSEKSIHILGLGLVKTFLAVGVGVATCNLLRSATFSLRGCVKFALAAKGSKIRATSRREICTAEYWLNDYIGGESWALKFRNYSVILARARCVVETQRQTLTRRFYYAWSSKQLTTSFTTTRWCFD